MTPSLKSTPFSVASMCHFLCRWSLSALLLFASLHQAHANPESDAEKTTTANADVTFNRDIRSLLSSRCFACHGPDEESREAGLRLDQADGDEGAIGLAIEPGSIEDSELWSRITSDDESMLMPPPDSHLKPFSKQEQQLIRRWIESGADYEAYWAFTPPTQPKTPEVQNQGKPWSDQTIDRFVLQKLVAQGETPAREADARTLIRRVTFDLTGLPPTREEIRQFSAAYADAPETAWEELIDDLISRPQYGEHWARHWLDLVRFADTNGMHKDFYRNHVAYRDWVIRAFNDNLRYDDFTRYQIAGDLYPNPTKDQLIASGFHRLHLIIDRGTALPEESHVKNVIDRVTAVGTAFMGLTVQCAQCHDHKFDPITQKDFFSLYAFFNNIDAAPETNPKIMSDGLQEPIARWPTAKQATDLKRFDKKLADANAKLSKIEIAIAAQREKESDAGKQEIIGDALSKQSQELTLLIKEQGTLQKRMAALNRERRAVERNVEKAMVMKERDTPRETFVLIRGQYDAPGKTVPRNVPGFLPPLKKASEVASRMDLAEWFVAPENPLTARVAVNRFWLSFFGVGLIKTAEDFGNQGEVPSHPELLDELAVSFVESGWDIKALVKRIAMTKTYRQASNTSPERFKADPENRLLARGPRYRLDAEVIRDQILATSGLISTKMHGPSVKPPQPDGLWKAVSMTDERFQPDTGDSIYRRSVYTFWKRAMPPPQMTILNAPFRDACIARRERTNTPSQALLLLNESEYLRAARHLAQLALERSEDERLAFAWETVTAKLPDANEQQIMLDLLDDLQEDYLADPKLTDELCRGTALTTPEAKSELAAWTVICNTLYNLDITKTKD
ncbi:PSD1 and planctomycete cytochrome C domain-containing protein [Neorhodopirellula lusitana]|nr:PSD1 and planctomycete cytochrome C domain-containing protein [Neorhodopirellula lusitana]